MKKLRFGVIGASGIADRRTIPGLLQAENAELVAVMSRDPDVAEKLRVKWGAKYAYTTAEALASCPEIDAVYIGTPPVCHVEQAKICADHGKHILIEKPLAMTADEGQELVDYC